MEDIIKVQVDNLTFDCRTAGNKDHQLVVLLHGFPETSYMWKHLMADLSEQGFYCVAPNMRGFSKDACPKGKKHYRLELLANDITGIAKALGKSKFHLIGHDWGAAVGWKVVYDNQDMILSWIGISVPHIQAFGEAIVKDKEQNKMSQYIRAFQWPWLPERRLMKNDLKLLRKLWKHSEPDEVEDYLSVFRNKPQLTAALNYYRANYKLLKKAAKTQVLGEIHVPTLFIWGNKDIAIGPVGVNNGHQYIKGDYTFLELDAGHWLIQTNYQDLKEAIEMHLGKHGD